MLGEKRAENIGDYLSGKMVIDMILNLNILTNNYVYKEVFVFI